MATKTVGVVLSGCGFLDGSEIHEATVTANERDALIFPGGYGAAKDLCTWAVDGVKMRVHPEVERLVQQHIDGT